MTPSHCAIILHCKNMRGALTNFGYIVFNVHEITPYMKHIEALRRYKIRQLNILLPRYCKNVLLENFPVIVIGKQLKGYLSGVFTCPV